MKHLSDSADWTPSELRHRAAIRANRTRKGEHARAAERRTLRERAEERRAEVQQALTRQSWT